MTIILLALLALLAAFVGFGLAHITSGPDYIDGIPTHIPRGSVLTVLAPEGHEPPDAEAVDLAIADWLAGSPLALDHGTHIVVTKVGR